jgi:hypothetical protein
MPFSPRGDEADFAGEALLAGVEFAVDEDAHADTVADVDDDEGGVVLALSEPVGAEGHHLGVVLDEDGDLVAFLDGVADDVDGLAGGVLACLLLVDEAGKGDAHAADGGDAGAGLLEEGRRRPRRSIRPVPWGTSAWGSSSRSG